MFGVFRATTKGFVGIREKFCNEYLFEEYHWDNGPPFGTVMPQLFLEVCPLSDLRESIGSFDGVTNRPVAFDKPIGWYFVDTGEASKAIHSVSRDNQEL